MIREIRQRDTLVRFDVHPDVPEKLVVADASGGIYNVNIRDGACRMINHSRMHYPVPSVTNDGRRVVYVEMWTCMLESNSIHSSSVCGTKAIMFDIETGNEVWSADSGWISSVITTSNGSIYASACDRKQFLKIDAETGDITELFQIVGYQDCIVQYSLCI